MVSPVLVASSDPVVTCWLDVSIKALISLARRGAAALRQRAHLPPPRPRSRGPVRPPSRLPPPRSAPGYWSGREMPSMTEMISWTLAELAAMSCMVAIMRRIALAAGLPAVCEAASAIALPCCALSVFCFTADVSCSMLAAVCSSDTSLLLGATRDRHCRSRAGTTRWKWRRRRSGCGTRSRSVARAWSPAGRSGCSRRRRWDAGSASDCHWRSRAPFPACRGSPPSWRSTARDQPCRQSAQGPAPARSRPGRRLQRGRGSQRLVGRLFAQARFQRGQRGQLREP